MVEIYKDNGRLSLRHKSEDIVMTVKHVTSADPEGGTGGPDPPPPGKSRYMGFYRE